MRPSLLRVPSAKISRPWPFSTWSVTFFSAPVSALPRAMGTAPRQPSAQPMTGFLNSSSLAMMHMRFQLNTLMAMNTGSMSEIWLAATT